MRRAFGLIFDELREVISEVFVAGSPPHYGSPATGMIAMSWIRRILSPFLRQWSYRSLARPESKWTMNAIASESGYPLLDVKNGSPAIPDDCLIIAAASWNRASRCVEAIKSSGAKNWLDVRLIDCDLLDQEALDTFFPGISIEQCATQPLVSRWEAGHCVISCSGYDARQLLMSLFNLERDPGT